MVQIIPQASSGREPTTFGLQRAISSSNWRWMSFRRSIISTSPMIEPGCGMKKPIALSSTNLPGTQGVMMSPIRPTPADRASGISRSLATLPPQWIRMSCLPPVRSVT